jgi:hypothetical protein
LDLDYEVIDVGLLWLEYFPCHYGESWAGILQAFGHSHKTEGTKRRDEASLFLILFRHSSLVVTKQRIQNSHDSGTSG